VVRSLPPRAALALASAAGDVWHAVDGRRRGRVWENLRVAFGPPRDLEERRRFVRRVFRQMMRVPVEVLLFPRLLRGRRDLERRCRLLGDWDLVAEDRDRGRGGLIVTGHLGNWELGGRCVRLFPLPVRVVVRPIENPWLDASATRSRGGPGAVIRKEGALKETIRTLRGGGWVAIVADQNAGRRGVFLPFFGLEASTWATPAIVALKTGAPVYVGATVRRPGPELAFDVRIRRLEPTPAGLDENEAARLLLGRIVRTLEGWIREHPEQYNWLHRRWKSRPPGEPRSPDLPSYAAPAVPAATTVPATSTQGGA
jgi:KDO2-lipid IV(A) lauroyltransferase